MPSLPTSDWRWAELAADSTASDAAFDWPHPDYSAAAENCGSSNEDISKLTSLCNDLESRMVLVPGWASVERIAGVKTGAFDCLRDLCWREILTHEEWSADVLTGLYRLGAAFRGNGMDTATRRTAIVIQLIARQKLKKRAGFFESAEDAQKLENERAQLLTRPYLPNFLANQLGA
jgi:hypothetical protein